MTREEAKKVFINRGYVNVKGGIIFDGDKWRQSVEVITEWLKEQPCDDAINRQAVLDVINEYKFAHYFECGEYIGEDVRLIEIVNANRLEGLVEDLPSVSMENTKIDWNYGEIKELINKYHPAILNNYLEEGLCIKNLPSVSTEKTGRWIDSSNGWMCSECNKDNTFDTNYCPNCGTKMEVEE